MFKVSRPSLRTVIISALFLVLLGDILFFESYSPLVYKLSVDGNARDFEGSLVLSELTYDRQTKSAQAQLGLEIKATQPDLDIRQIAFSFHKNPDGSRDLTNCHLEDGCLIGYQDVPGPNGKALTSAKTQLKSIRLQGIEDPAEIFYPFDKSTFKLSLLGCVNQGLEECSAANSLSFRTVTIELADPDFVLEGGRNDSAAKDVVFALQRKPFVRLVSVIFLVIGIVFFVYLMRISKPDELMTKSLGFFGALWALRALLVPGTVTVFPTLVDYVILGTFCLLFVSIVFRVRDAPGT